MSAVELILDRPVCSVVTGLLIIIYFAGLIGGQSFAEKTSLVLSDTVGSNFYIWNLFTAGLFETNIIKITFDILWVCILGRKAEGSMGTENFAIYVTLVNLSCGAITSTILFILYVITRFETYLFRATYGFGGLSAAISIVLKLSSPKELLFPSLSSSFQYQHLPILHLLISLISYILGIDMIGLDAPFVIVGTYIGWWYLRFVHVRNNSENTHGDNSEEFAFVTLFPPPLRRYISPLADFCYGVSILLGFFKERKPPPPRVLVEDSDRSSNKEPIPQDPVAERRRAKAREQLDAKLAAMADQDEEWDDDEPSKA